MSAQQSHPADRSETPRWLNVVAVAALILFITGGFLILKKFGGSHDRDLGEGSPLPRDDDLVTPRLVRPGERPAGLIFTDADINDADEFHDLANRDPKAAASIIARLEDTPIRDERLYTLMTAWVEKDPTQAADWVSALPFGDLKNDATAELGLAWGKSDPAATARWVDENIFTLNAPAGAASLTSAWAKSDIESASEWVAGLDTDAPARREAIRALAYKLGELDPQRGISWLSRLTPQDRKLILVNFTASWSDHDPAAAASWLRYQAKGVDQQIRDQATLAVIHSWTSTEDEAPAAADWIDGLEDGTLKENAKATFAETHADTSPAEAFPWARDLEDDERRLEVTMVVLEEWLVQDMDGFQTEMRDRWETLDEPLRHEIYDLLLDHDPQFKKELFELLDERATEDS